MKSLRLVVLVLSVAIVTSAFAAGPEGFKDWDNSPQGYFMTRAEHAEWSALKTPEEQQRFVDQFLAKRGPDFPAMVASRAAQADKHLTLGKLAGSRTLRGKLVILFGPPSGMDISRDTDISRDEYGWGNAVEQLSFHVRVDRLWPTRRDDHGRSEYRERSRSRPGKLQET
jgi:GWxTD domain-containing protein